MTEKELDEKLGAIARKLLKSDATALLIYAELQATSSLLREVCSATGLTQIGGVPLVEWLAKQQKNWLEELLIRIENFDSALAAELQRQIDEAGQKASEP